MFCPSHGDNERRGTRRRVGIVGRGFVDWPSRRWTSLCKEIGHFHGEVVSEMLVKLLFAQSTAIDQQ